MKTKRHLIQICLLCAVLLLALTSEAQPVTKVAAGWIRSLFLKSDGSLWGMGDNGEGELGDGVRGDDINRPELFVTNGVTAIASGHFDFTLFLKSDGSLWGLGENDGELGNGLLGSYYLLPQEIVTNGVTAIAAGYGFTLFIKSDGSLWGMGDNSNGQLGDGTYNSTNQPEQLVASNVVAIAAGDANSLFLKSDGSLWGMGANPNGVVTNRPIKIVTGRVTAIAAGGSFALFIKSDGSLWGMGANDYGQLGDGTTAGTYSPVEIVASGVTAIAAGDYHSLFVKSDGSLWAMGQELAGQLGDGIYVDPYAPDTYYGTNRPEEIVTGSVTAIAAGYEHSLFVKSDGSLWAMGNDTAGELGDGTGDGNGIYETNRPEQILGDDFQYTASPTNGSPPMTVQLTSPSVDNGGNLITNWNWNFGDGSTSTAQNPSHIYTSVGTYFPSLAVTNNLGEMVLAYGPSITASILTGQSSRLANGANQTGTIPVNTTNVYTFIANAGDSIFLRLGTTNFDGELQLYAPNGSLLSTVGGLAFTDVNIAGPLPSSGTYTVLISSISSGGSGTYIVRLAQAPESFVVPVGDEGGALTGTQHYQGKITLADIDMWSFTVFKGDFISLELNTTNFNGLFQLYGPNGALLVTSANLTNTDIIISGTLPSSGTYMAFVTSQFSGGTGTYGLTVNGLTDGFKLSSPVIAGTNLMFTGVGGESSGMFVLYSAINLAGIWTPVLTNHFDQFGVFNVTNTFNPSLQKQGYFRFQLP